MDGSGTAGSGIDNLVIEQQGGVFTPSLEFVRERVSTIDLDIGYFHAEAKLEERDLGIDDDNPESEAVQKRRSYTKLGHKFVIPDRYVAELGKLEHRMRDKLKRWCFRVDFGSQSLYLITDGGFAAFKKDVAEDVTRFFAIRDELVNDYDKIVEEVRTDWTIQASQIWDKRNPDYAGQVPGWFVRDYVNPILGKIPPPDEIAQKFYVRWRFDEIRMPVASAAYKSERVKQLEEQEAQLEARINELIEDMTRVQDDPEVASRYQKLLAEKAEIEEAKAIRLEIERNKAETQAEEYEKTVGVFLRQINDMLYQVATDTLMVLKDPKHKGKLAGRNSLRISRWVEEVKALNFFKDTEAGAKIDRMMEEIKTVMEFSSKSRDLDGLQERLRDIRAFATVSLMEITGDAPRTKSERERPDVIEPAQTLVKRGRGRDISDLAPVVEATTPRRTRGGTREVLA